MTTTRVAIGTPTHCIQIGHYGAHPAAADCLCIDDAGRCYSPRPDADNNSCDHRLSGGPLVCTRSDPHQPGHGCTYESTSHVDAEPA